MPLWLETINDPWDYERARQGANYSYQSFALYKWVHKICKPHPATSLHGAEILSLPPCGLCNQPLLPFI